MDRKPLPNDYYISLFYIALSNYSILFSLCSSNLSNLNFFHYIITKSISEISTDGTEDENAATSSAFKKARSEFKNPAKYVERGIFNVLKFNF